MNVVQDNKLSQQKWNQLFYEMVTNMKYKKSTIDRVIYIKVFSDGTVSYLTVSTDDVMNKTTSETTFPELRKLVD